MDKKTIVVKGVGTVSAKPDYTVLMMTLNTTDLQYDKTMEEAAIQIDELERTVTGVGFEEHSIKTLNFHVETVYESIRDKNNNYKEVFKGYRCTHQLKLAFDFEPELLSKVLSAISGCSAKPDLNIQFTVKDPAAVSEKLIENAAQNARSKAEILCRASGVKLGELITINYDWTDLTFTSRTMMLNSCAGEARMAKACFDSFEPEEIRQSDTATFVWTIE